MLLAAAAVAVAAFPLRATWWGGWILAIAEAGVVGGLADWFAVTALFRHPLGVPIPHTALIPANWRLMAQRVGLMVGDRVLTVDYVTREISRVDVADLLGRAAFRVERRDIESALGEIGRWVADQLPTEAVTDLVVWLRSELAGRPAAPLLADLLEAADRYGYQQRVIQALAEVLADALERPHVREAVGALVEEVLQSYRARMGVYPSFLLGLASMIGLIDRQRLVAALHAAVRHAADDPSDPLRRRLAEALGELPARLRADAGLAARIEAAKDELLASPVVVELIEKAAAGLRDALAADLTAGRSELVDWAADQLERIRQRIVSDADMRRGLDRWIKAQAAVLVHRHQHRVAEFIERGVHALGPEGAVALIEEHAGDDLQYIRVNGTVVGGLAGGAIYAAHLLLRWL